MVRITLDEATATYDEFVERLTDALATRLSEKLKKSPMTVCSQREAYRRFGTGNVRRWVKEGRLAVHAKRPGKIEYKISELQALFDQEQDYFTVPYGKIHNRT